MGQLIKPAAILYSLVVPIYKDSELAESFCQSVLATFGKLFNNNELKYNLELLFVSDGSGEKDENNLKALSLKYDFVKLILLSRNFGQHLAISCGYKYSVGKWVAMLNVDQQDPVDELPKFFEFAKNKNLDRVYGLRDKRQSSFFETFTSNIFNITLNKLTNSDIPLNISTMRVMSRRFIDSYNELTESQRFLPGLENWLGFECGYVPTTHSKRNSGKSSYTFRKRLRMAISSILSFSDYPLRLIVKLGVLVCIMGFVGIALMVVAKLSGFEFQAGFPALIAAVVTSTGILTVVVGVASLYIGRILAEVQGRPSFVVKEFINNI